MRIGKLFDSLKGKNKSTMSEQNINEEIQDQNINPETQNEEVTTSNEKTETVEEQVEQKSEVEVLKEELQKEKEQYLRLFAEFDNYKKRTSRERMDIFKTANKEVITALLPVLDDLDRAMPQIKKSEDEALVTGVELIQNKLNETLRGKGLIAMEVKAGDDFNTDLHEAITQIPAPTEDLKGKIVDCVETGYLLQDVVIRYAKVVVGM
jgi:molecular chaperone GrpE